MEETKKIEIEQQQVLKQDASATQIGTQNNNYGLSFSDTRDLCIDLIKSELACYKHEAEEIAIQRTQGLLDNFLERLSKERMEDKELFEELKNPDMQCAYLDAQKSFMRLGTEELEDALAQLLMDRIKEKDRTLLQIALGEALSVVPILLPEQLDILALSFLLRYTRKLEVNSMQTLYKYLLTNIFPHISGDQKRISMYQHLVYARTGNMDLVDYSLEKIFSNNYSGLFMDGFDIAKIETYFEKYPKLFTKCLQSEEKLQIDAINITELTKILVKEKVPLEDKTAIEELYKQNLLPENTIKNIICKNLPNGNYLFDLWNNSNLKRFSLTSIGIVLGANRSKQISGETYDMNIWI